MQSISVGDILERYGERLALKAVAGLPGLQNDLKSSDLHRPGLALTGFVGLFAFDQAQMLGNTEMLYLGALRPARRRAVVETIYQFDIPCVIITDDNDVPRLMTAFSDSHDVPLLVTSYSTTKFSHLWSYFLDDLFAPETTIHGTLVDVYGIGLLFVGRSGIGKSEIALDLVERGHCLVADDVVIVSRKWQGSLVGTSGDGLRDHMEIRGLGILNAKRMFGVRAVRLQKQIEVVVQLVEWEDFVTYDRVGIDEDWVSILDVEISKVTVPIYPGKNITVIAEAIALNYQLKLQGLHTGQEFNKRLVERMQDAASPGKAAGADSE